MAPGEMRAAEWGCTHLSGWYCTMLLQRLEWQSVIQEFSGTSITYPNALVLKAFHILISFTSNLSFLVKHFSMPLTPFHSHLLSH